MKIEGLSQIVAKYDVYFIDLWGVLHNGQQAFPQALLTLAELKLLKKKVILLSNSPRRAEESAQRIEELGILPQFYDEIYTSGENCFQTLENSSSPYYKSLGTKYYHIGPSGNKSMAADLSGEQVTDIKEAEFLLVTGTNGWEEEVTPYIPLLTAAYQRKLPLICANPDRYVSFNDKMMICAGSLAKYYEDLGGQVLYHGKPYPEIYQTLMEKISPLKKQQILAIGDSLYTDITGAAQQGIDTLLILGGIHNKLKKESFPFIRDFALENFQVAPTYIEEELKF